MEEYINNNTIIQNDLYKIFQDSIICPLCNNIFIKPVMCMKCQNAFCKKCIDDWSKNNQQCPNGCNDANYQNCIGKNDLLSKLKFKCIGCEKEIEYSEAEKHHGSCCPDKNLPDIHNDICKNNNNNDICNNNITKTPYKRKMERIKKEDIEKLKVKGKISYITGKNNF